MSRLAITDLKRQYEALAAEIRPAVEAVFASGWYIKGPVLQACEQELAAYLGVKYAVGVNSGTDALILALLAAGIGPGDKVITSAMSFTATAEAISRTGAEPVFVDILPGNDCLNPALLEGALVPGVKAVLPIHLHGYPCDMQAILAFARNHGLKVIEDCAQAIGASYHGQKVGALGDAGCFSFFPTKNLGCYGDGGLITTDSEPLYAKLQGLREHGMPRKNIQDYTGFNSRLDAVQAAILRVKLPYLEGWNSRRRELARHYHTLLEGVNVQRPPLEISEATTSVFHHYALRVPAKRDVLQKAMAEAGFECLAYYPVAQHRQAVYADRWPENSCPEAELAAETTLAIPLFPELLASEQEAVVSALKQNLEVLYG
ncbi:erythromycin biosynthesis sensory transduction protein eryC1 [bacterium (Candidatus Blackallbacteria) CG17_big_fil_post_rev_8_21_14_2_50_48_46]|uniref:Erythromycin biosynthesis sensory transduction protein eryC1 n=1 Tax=bacterium (Candidatus Blackallbacteria) CG17_big_fil_post_rev_8_21_14_2_50_48_46 TaxID=2014261 RepID=A0A2M7G8S8_9BACT|nr:MAG: erythromycin biosynthesis sensory transduction protein eryC1 [bacterium (Candidatus Blackallbacteria) CG18_big_fil_WC_8_21_14_2_50_49_26]PIW18497.1 MAG: erythromycin biosynthesis sensory transduction protein eryC1 [bacterium (Candidatus Blackallbacteria) CG17_big_fil_post_rev_8_21_14_2_50_48_46]PIW46518.1 MAG: erythromycin biosynthesis sensory transduction protein eryC1 [bacterium (Candidatus Blackallbacteria) CG13_big_fil_rev_8_21_14_2_50_49_14]